VKLYITMLAVLAGLAFAQPAVAKPPQVLPEPMLVNLFALTEASATLQICANSDLYAALPAAKKKLLGRLQTRIDGLVKSIAAKFDNDLFGFFQVERDNAARSQRQIEQVRLNYGTCGDALFKRMQWYVYDSRLKLDLFLSKIPDVK